MWIRIKTHGLVPEVIVRKDSILMATPIIKGGCRIFLDPSKHEVCEFDTVISMDTLFDMLIT